MSYLPGPRLRAAQVFAATLAVAGGAFADPACDETLHAARAQFAAGELVQAVRSAQDCLELKPDRAEQRIAYELVVRAHLVLDDLAAARVAVAELIRVAPEFEPSPLDPVRFASLVREARANDARSRVRSVSKNSESLLEAPATVVVITRDEIRRRGYQDLPAMLRDVPGFDQARGNGFVYSNIYQRGFRSQQTDRMLFLVDGVEQNNLSANTAFMSRQYPLSNIDRVEIVYGPASTIYGDSAFSGVINVVTLNPDDLVGAGRRLGATAELVTGSWGTRFLEFNVAGRIPEAPLSFLVSGRVFHSDEYDLGAFADWDFDPGFYDRFDYRDQLRITDPTAVGEFVQQLRDPSLPIGSDCSGQPGCDYRVTDESIELTEEGAARARAFDKAAFKPGPYEDPTDDWLVRGELHLSNLELGFQTWRRAEGSLGVETDQSRPGGRDTFALTPQSTSLFARYDRRLAPNLTLGLFSRFRHYSFDNERPRVGFTAYANGGRSLLDLLAPRDGATDGERGLTAGYSSPVYFSVSNLSLRNELNLSWTPRRELNLVGGLDLGYSSIGASNINSSEPGPLDTGSPSRRVDGGNAVPTRDVGGYVQASYRLRDDLTVVGAGRLDNSRERESFGYGTVFSPRLAVVYTPGSWVLKGVHARAFFDPPNFQKFETSAQRELPNPDLEPGRVRSTELSIGWRPRPDLVARVDGYDSRYGDSVDLVTVDCVTGCSRSTTEQFRNTGSTRVRGLQAEVRWSLADYDLYSNYTSTSPIDVSGARVGDVARHQLNLGVNRLFRERYNVNLRANVVGGRPRGAGTTVRSDQPTEEIASYLVVNGSLRWLEVVPGVSLQLTIENLLDTSYEHPGIGRADGVDNASVLPQPGRSLSFRLSFAR